MINAFPQADRSPHFLRLHGRGALPPNKLTCNTIFRDLGLFPHMKVSENVAYGLKVRGVDPAPRRNCAVEMLGIVGRDGYERRRTPGARTWQNIQLCPASLRSTSHVTPAAIIFLHSLSSGARSSSASVMM
jgi:hypothetical protein